MCTSNLALIGYKEVHFFLTRLQMDDLRYLSIVSTARFTLSKGGHLPL